MTNEDRASNRLSKFSNAGRHAYAPAQRDTAFEQPPTPRLEAKEQPLADLLEHAIRGAGLAQGEPPPDDAAAFQSKQPGVLPEKLIEELKTAQEKLQSEPPPESPLALEEPLLLETLQQPAAPPDAPAAEETAALELSPADEIPVQEDIARPSQFEGAGIAHRAKAALVMPGGLSRRMRWRDWRRRRLALLSVVHRRVFDRKTEELLFCKTPALQVYSLKETQEGPEKTFVYEGPIPKKLLDWALSAAPQDLKRYAFVDFRAGNGRTLLLAARRNFEYAAGYAFDAASAEMLEMNLAQYPRSYLSCRDVRALRADRDGVLIPPQPAVLFFPDSLSDRHLDVILNYVLASFRLEPRPITLIFENAGRERGNESMTIFERAPMPLINRAKAFLFGPVKIAVYRSKF